MVNENESAKRESAGGMGSTERESRTSLEETTPGNICLDSDTRYVYDLYITNEFIHTSIQNQHVR